MTTLSPNEILYWFYLASGLVLLTTASFAGVAWWMHRGVMAWWITMSIGAAAFDALIKALLRSPQAIVPQLILLHGSRIATVVMVIAAIGLVDVYLASRNGHLDVLRRVWRWWDRRKDLG